MESKVFEFLMYVINEINRKMCGYRYVFKCYIIKSYVDKDGYYKMLWFKKRFWNISNEVKINKEINLVFLE